MNLTQTRELIEKASERVDALAAQQTSGKHFSLPTEDARRHLTSITGVSFDLKQTANELYSTQAALRGQLLLVDALHEKCTIVFDNSIDVTQALLGNVPPA